MKMLVMFINKKLHVFAKLAVLSVFGITIRCRDAFTIYFSIRKRLEIDNRALNSSVNLIRYTNTLF